MCPSHCLKGGGTGHRILSQRYTSKRPFLLLHPCVTFTYNICSPKHVQYPSGKETSPSEKPLLTGWIPVSTFPPRLSSCLGQQSELGEGRAGQQACDNRVLHNRKFVVFFFFF